jgi:chromosomal replication initiator protein
MSGVTSAAPVLEMARDHIEERDAPRAVSVDTIKRFVSAHYGVGIADLVSTRRQKTTVLARHVALYLTRQLTNYSLPQIARHFGKRDHRSIMDAVHRIDRLTDEDGHLAGEVAGLIFSLTPHRRIAA